MKPGTDADYESMKERKVKHRGHVVQGVPKAVPKAVSLPPLDPKAINLTPFDPRQSTDMNTPRPQSRQMNTP